MTRDELNYFRKALQAAVGDLDGSARRRDAIQIEGSADELDRMQRANEREIAVRSIESASTKRREIYAALRRIEDGTYGSCLECDEMIGPKRLAAVPWTTLCIRCREALDCDCAAKNARPVFALAA